MTETLFCPVSETEHVCDFRQKLQRLIRTNQIGNRGSTSGDSAAMARSRRGKERTDLEEEVVAAVQAVECPADDDGRVITGRRRRRRRVRASGGTGTIAVALG
jgi:hypothetical protein